jgi:hypothetical protein
MNEWNMCVTWKHDYLFEDASENKRGTFLFLNAGIQRIYIELYCTETMLA